MAKEVCPNCNVKMPRPVSFCPECSRPTSQATEAEVLEWDLAQWRRHVEGGVAAGAASSTVTLPSVALASKRPAAVVAAPAPRSAAAPAPAAPPVTAVVTRRPAPVESRTPAAVLDAPSEPAPRKERGATLRAIASTFRRTQVDRVIVLDADDPFAYTACTSCERSDWIVRTTRNEDRTYNYWCCRCSRTFKTDARLRNAMKPFIAAGSVIGLLATLSVVMR